MEKVPIISTISVHLQRHVLREPSLEPEKQRVSRFSASHTSGVDVYLTSNKARLQKYLIIRYSEEGHLLDL